MLKAAIMTKPMMYQPDGSGRDTQIHNIHVNEHDRNFTLTNFGREKFNPIRTGFSRQYRKPIPAAPQGEERVPIYQADGKGRDSYILQNRGGFIDKYKPYKFHNDLRVYEIINRRGFNVRRTSSDYQNWHTGESAKNLHMRKQSVDNVTKNLQSPSNFHSRNSKLNLDSRITFAEKKQRRTS